VKVLATQPLPGPAWTELADVTVGRPDELHADVEVLIVANETVDEAVLDRLPALRLVANFSVGCDRIDLSLCRARGIAVTNTPGVLDGATADLTFALILAARRRLVEADGLVRAGGWTTRWSEGSLLGQEVTGATLGIVGLGRIGAAVARRARGFEMRVLYHQRARAAGVDYEYRRLDELLREADVVSLHVPLTPETAGLLSAERLALMRDGATFVNTARGAIVDMDALEHELVSGRLTAGLDVFAHEPSVPEALLSLPNVVLTPHVASATVETRAAMTRIVVDNVLAFERGEPLRTPV
jgi:lactate dehydrogenase-like 2-hydroxyacid dehydrogenase